MRMVRLLQWMFPLKRPAGELIAIGGPSGSGKTTCLLGLLGLARVSAGQIRIDGEVLADGESLAESVAYVRQLPWITEGSVADNLRLARAGATRQEMESALRQVGALDLIDARYGGFDRALSRFGGGLSGGERQRIALARAILRGAPIFLLDEPTAHLDEVAERDLLLLLRALARDRTVLMAAHRPAALAAADRVVLLQPAPRQGAPR